MCHDRMSLRPTNTSDEFLEAFKSILECIVDGKKACGGVQLTAEQLKAARSLHELVSTGDLRTEPA